MNYLIQNPGRMRIFVNSLVKGDKTGYNNRSCHKKIPGVF
jgi:hypothetical protein